MKIMSIIALILSTALYAQDSPQLKGKDVTYSSGKDTVKAYISVPEGKGPFPGLIVIHEWWGLTDWVKNNADLLAKEGYAALAIDLYRGKIATTPDEAHQIMRALPEDRAVRDLKAAYQFLSTQDNIKKGNIGSIGWCMGGGYSLDAALNIPQLKSCVICYGRLVTEDESIHKIKTPILGIFGEEDKGIQPSDVRTFETALKEDKKDVKVIIYPGVGHAFMNPGNKEGYSKEKTDQAWKEIKTFLAQKLK